MISLLIWVYTVFLGISMAIFKGTLTFYFSVCTTVGVDKSGDPTRCLCPANIGQVYEALLTAMRDYTVDSRGDVGAW